MATQTKSVLIYGLLIRLGATLMFCLGVGFIAFGCVLENPPSTLVPGGSVAVGVFSMIGGILGMAGAYYQNVVLILYLVFGSLVTLIQFIITIGLFAAKGKIVEKIKEYDNGTFYSGDELAHKVDVGKGVFMTFVLLEIISLGVTVAMRLKSDVARPYAGFDLESQDRRDVQMNIVKTDLNRNAPSSEDKAYGRIASKLDKKYGKYTQSAGVDLMKGHRWYNIFGNR